MEGVLGIVVPSVVGLGFLYAGGEALVRGASALARRSGISPLAIGLTVVAFGTSSPELAVSIEAALAGASDVSVGNVVGSNIANVTLILGSAAVLRPCVAKAKIVRVDAPLVVLASVVLVFLLADGTVGRAEGAALAGALAVYTAFTLREAKSEPPSVQEEFSPLAASRRSGVLPAAALSVLGLFLLFSGGHLFVQGSVALARWAGVSEAVVGLTVVAVGTSLPELAATAVASFRGRSDLALGNVLGSNLFNILGVLGLSALARPLRPQGISWADLGAMVFLASLAAVFVGTGLRVGRFEGVLLLACFCAYWGWLWLGGGTVPA
ncbi:MAG: sodium:calcium antiporter [Candidatus Binatia bacterium]|nr:MAG: sodium:calcium antiporter [Candidatus Binatia bacterium]